MLGVNLLDIKLSEKIRELFAIALIPNAKPFSIKFEKKNLMNGKGCPQYRIKKLTPEVVILVKCEVVTYRLTY